MKFKEVRILRYGPLQDIHIPCGGLLTVVYGLNESGKTLTVEALVRLLAPKAARGWHELERVQETPEGYVILEWRGSDVKIDRDTSLADIEDMRLEDQDVRSLLVIRDSDLKIPKEDNYYEALTERLAGVRLRELDQVIKLLREDGRLTPTLRLANEQSSHYPQDSLDQATQLADEIRKYADEANEKQFNALEAQLLELESKLSELKARKASLELARYAFEYRRLSQRLAEARQALGTAGALTAFTQNGLDVLRELEGKKAEAVRIIQELEGELAGIQKRVKELESEERDKQSEFEPLQRRAPLMDNLQYQSRQTQESLRGADAVRREIHLARRVALISLTAAGLGLLGGGLTGHENLLIIGILFGTIAVTAILWFLIRNRVIGRREASAETVIHAAREAGLEVAGLGEISAKISAFQTGLEQQREKITGVRAAIEAQREQKQRLQDRLSEPNDLLITASTDLGNRLAELDVESVEEYAAKVAEVEQARTDLMVAASPLRDYFQSGPEEPLYEDLSAWESELERLSEKAQDADPEEYDENTYDAVSQESDDAESKVNELKDLLAKHRRRLDQFSERVLHLTLESFTDEPLERIVDSTRQLPVLAEQLENVARHIRRDADESRAVIGIFQTIRQDEESKVAHLFGEDDRASRIFAKLTRGRYTGVEYDPLTHRISATRDGKEPLEARLLSHGAFDQLYLAVRVALSEQLLDGEPGFFVMDDAFLAADKNRLRQGFESLQSLAEAGWSILYFTAKDEVGERLAPKLGLPIVELQELP